MANIELNIIHFGILKAYHHSEEARVSAGNVQCVRKVAVHLGYGT
jgi:hypothetical protein